MPHVSRFWSLPTLVLLVLLPLFAWAQSGPSGTPVRLYVDQSAVGTNTGGSWANAYTSLQDALAEARTLVPADSVEIWVARGVYYPDVGAGLTPNSRLLAFELVSTVAVYGGFAGGESALDQRDWLANPTILSGDIDGNDTVDADGLTTSHTGIVGNNSYHVVRANNAAPGTVLDGVSITGGLANGGGAVMGIFLMRSGAGLHSLNSSLTLRNVRIQGNLAPNAANGADGGGAYFFSSPSSSNRAMLSGVQFINNRGEFGGGLNTFRTNLTITESLVRGNEAESGGGLFLFLASVDILNSRIEANSAMEGGGMYGFRDFLTLVNSELRGNFATSNGGGYLVDTSTNFPVPQLLTNVTVSGNRAGGVGGGIHRAQATVGESILFNTILWNNQDSTGIGTASASHGGPGAARIDASHSLLQGSNPAGPNNLDGTLAANNPQFITPINPALAPTSAGNLRVSPGAPTIDRGDNGARINPLANSPPPIPLAGNLLFDLDGLERITDGSGNGIDTVDLGPYERGAAVRPIADSGPDRNVTSGILVFLDGNGSTSPGGALPLSYAWTQLSGQTVNLLNSEAVAPFFAAPFVNDDLVFELVVTDSLGAISEPDTVTITVSLPEYQVTASPVGQGSVTPASQVVVWDQTANLTVVPDPGWLTDQLLGNTCTPALVAGDQWQASNIRDNCAIEAIFTVNAYPIGGTVSGLEGTGLALDLNGIELLPIASNGSFVFSTEVDHESSYSVSVSTQPSAPSQVCTVTNGSGTVNAAAVTNITVSCSTSQFMVGGTLTGLAAGNSLVLQNNGGDDLLLSSNGSFNFATALDDLSSYSVTLLAGPSSPAQTCTVSNATGSLAGANVTDVQVSCETDQFSIGGSVSGLAAGSSLMLQNNGGDDLLISTNGSFVFATLLDDLGSYAVSISSQPTSPAQTCTVSNATGSLAGANVTDVQVSCQTDQFSIGGSVSGLAAGNSLTLQNNGGDDLVVNANGEFTFSTAIDDFADYLVEVSEPSLGQFCSVSNASGTLAGANVDDVAVDCIAIQIVLSATAVDFMTAAINVTEQQSLTLSNIGPADLEVLEFVAPGAPFELDPGSCAELPLTLAPGESCSATLSFAPLTFDTFQDILLVLSDSESSPDQVTISGVALPPALPVPIDSLWTLLLLMAGLMVLAVRQLGTRPS